MLFFYFKKNIFLTIFDRYCFILKIIAFFYFNANNFLKNNNKIGAKCLS